ncbi:ATP-binding cassette domain-containing protein [Nesterenkonia sp. CF4.4]|uniref:ATP-binding cassette domain-containing protein n=1 Tax=Nesterenkonia sp. CF4.4 TaxID=3373079 RepID=UPI003EE4805F
MTIPAEQPAVAATSLGGRSHLVRRMLGNPLGLVASVYLLALVVLAVIGPFIVPNDPSSAQTAAVFAPMGGEYILGGDSAGRDVFSRLIVATSFSLAGAAITVLVAVGIGVPAGLYAGYQGGWFADLSAWFAGLLLSLPAMVVLLAARAVIGPSLWMIMVIFGILISPAYYRVVFTAVRAVREEMYIDAARVAGLSDVRIIFRHVLSAVRAPAILLTSGIFAAAIAIQAAVDFLGLGDPALPTWGAMLSEGFYNIYRSPSLLVWPSLAIALTCIAFTLFGTALRDELELTGDKKQRSGQPWAPSAQPIDATILRVEEWERGHPLLAVRDLAVAYREGSGWKTVVEGVSLSVARGEIHALVGESGSGKTQTAWSALGLLPDGGRVVAGSIVFDGQELIGQRRDVMAELRGRRIGYIPQEPLSNLDPSYTIGHQLTEPLRVVLGLDKVAARSRALELLAKVDLPDPERTFDSYPHEISGGMAQRVLIAGAISCEPDLIIADEPTTALDVTVQAEILGVLRNLQTETGMGMLLVTHNFGVVADIANTVSVMRQGSILETGPVGKIFSDPQHEYTRELLDSLLSDAPSRVDESESEATR